MRKLIIILALPLLLGAWGPIGHIELASKHKQEQGIESNVEQAYYTGTVYPDVMLAKGAYHPAHRQLHGLKYVAALESLATSEHAKAFVKGYKIHLAGDAVESPYSAERMAQGAPYGADWAVDDMICTLQWMIARPTISLGADLADLMVRAWQRAYPSEPLPFTHAELASRSWYYNFYMILMQWINFPDAGYWYGDYEEYLR